MFLQRLAFPIETFVTNFTFFNTKFLSCKNSHWSKFCTASSFIYNFELADLSSPPTPSPIKIFVFIQFSDILEKWYTPRFCTSPPSSADNFISVSLAISVVDLRGAPGMSPPGVQILSVSCTFQQKICKIIPIWELAHPHRENPGSATASNLPWSNKTSQWNSRRDVYTKACYDFTFNWRQFVGVEYIEFNDVLNINV